MSIELSDLNQTIKELRIRISDDPDPFLLNVIHRLLVIRDNQQSVLVKKANDDRDRNLKGGFRGCGIS